MMFFQDSDLVSHDLIILFLRTVFRGESVDAQASGHIDMDTFLDSVQILYIASLPCHDVVPHAFVDSTSFAGLVKEVCHHGEVHDFAAVVLIDTYCSDAPLELDFVDMFDVFHKKEF